MKKEYWKSKEIQKKYDIAMERLEILPRLKLSEQFKDRTIRNMAEWVQNPEKRIKDCPLKKYWWQEDVKTSWKKVKA